MTPLRLGVIGPGIQWQGHRDILLTLTCYATIAAISARTLEKAQVQAQKCGDGVAVFDDYQAMLRDAPIDAVVVTTPIAINGPATIAALAAGKHVFVEKPLAASSAQAQQIIEAQQASGKQVYILENLLYTDAWDKLRALWKSGGADGQAEGGLGTLAMFDRAMHGRIAVGGDPYGFGDTAWRVGGEFPLGPLFDGGIHEIALQAKLFGHAHAVMARGQNFRPEHGDYDNICALIEYDDNVIGQITHSGLMAGHANYFNIRCTEGLIECDYVSATVKPFAGESHTVWFADEAQGAGAFWPSLAQNMWAELLDACVDGGRPGRYRLPQAAHDIATLEAVERSLKSGQREAVCVGQ